MRRCWRWLAAGGAVLALAGCTLQEMRRVLADHADAGYEQARRNQQEACDRLPAAPAREACEARLPPASFEDYERMRRNLPRQPGPRRPGMGETRPLAPSV